MTIKQQIWDKLDKDGYITDFELYKIYGKQPNFDTATNYKEEWRNFNNAKQCFAEIEDTLTIHKGRRAYYISTPKMEENQWIKIPKIYFEYLKKQGKKEIEY